MATSSDSGHHAPAHTDRDAVTETVTRYTYALDDRDWALLDEVFAPDAVVRYGAAAAPEVRGRADIVAMIRSFLDRCGPSQHLLGNHIVDIDGDTASSVCKARVLHLGAGDNSNITYECVGVYRDRLTRSAHGWRIIERTFVIDIELGDRHAVLGGPTR
ncbi:nuclear transport factor 2 family protein [Nocardia flavorosea]|uniref:Nuclear transport factor 2 family protein n=1 Tax=Nocardia flavorosea TaxID=53429 RepID=A0A846YNL8_9NOCA|nr:nuclear transport factor 2 family protein [Nocardia flavorosea]NKY60717.1 nuclear transport factor 2 family protein [Nocardia flavorosea]